MAEGAWFATLRLRKVRQVPLRQAAFAGEGVEFLDLSGAEEEATGGGGGGGFGFGLAGEGAVFIAVAEEVGQDGFSPSGTGWLREVGREPPKTCARDWVPWFDRSDCPRQGGDLLR